MKTKKFIAFLLVLLILCKSTRRASADTVLFPEIPKPLATETDVGAAISSLKKGQVAPFTGILLSPKAAATIVVQLDSLKEQIKIELQKAKAEEIAKCDFKTSELITKNESDKKIFAARLDEQIKVGLVLQDRLKKEESSRVNTPLWVGVGTTLGVITGIGITLLSVYTINQVSK